MAADASRRASLLVAYSFAVLTPGGVFAEAEVGVIGLPIIMAMGGINWSNSGTAEFGGTLPGSSEKPNLVFDRSRLVLRAEVLGKEVLAAFDTGANSTDLNANSAGLFPDAVAAGKKAMAKIANRAFDGEKVDWVDSDEDTQPS